MQDRRDLNAGGGYEAQQEAYQRARAYNASQRILRNRDIKTTTQRPGTGGQSPGIGIQQERYRDIGRQNDRQASMRPKVDDTIYDVYKTN